MVDEVVLVPVLEVEVEDLVVVAVRFDDPVADAPETVANTPPVPVELLLELLDELELELLLQEPSETILV